MIDKKLVYKSISYRVFVTACTVPFTGLGIAIWLALMATVIYYIHEKLWNKYENKI